MFSRAREELPGTLRTLERRPGPTAVELELRLRVDRPQLGQRTLHRLAVVRVRDSDVDQRLGLGRDDVVGRPAADDADVHRDAPALVIQPLECLDLVSQLLDRAHAGLAARARVRRAPPDPQPEAA